MKKKYLLLVAVATVVTISSCKKDDKPVSDPPATGKEVKKEQKAVAFYYTGITCNPCGSIGIPNFKTIKTDKASVLVPIEVHLNIPGLDPLQNAYGDTLSALIVSQNSISIPKYFTGNLIVSGTAGTAVTDMEKEIDKVVGKVPVLNTSLETSRTGNTLKVKVRLKAFEQVSGQYKVALYVLEDEVNHRQVVNGQYVDPFIHHNVLRSAIGSTFGNAMVNGSINKDDVIEKEFTTELGSSWNKEHLKVAAVIWKFTPNPSGGSYVAMENGMVEVIK